MLWKERHTGRTRKLPVLDTPVRWLGGLFTLIAVMLFATGGWQLVKRALWAMDPVEAERLRVAVQNRPIAATHSWQRLACSQPGCIWFPLLSG